MLENQLAEIGDLEYASWITLMQRGELVCAGVCDGHFCPAGWLGGFLESAGNRTNFFL